MLNFSTQSIRKRICGLGSTLLGRFDVTVNDPLPMHISECFADLDHPSEKRNPTTQRTV